MTIVAFLRHKRRGTPGAIYDDRFNDLDIGDPSFRLLRLENIFQIEIDGVIAPFRSTAIATIPIYENFRGRSRRPYIAPSQVLPVLGLNGWCQAQEGR